jgi:hypothetical protein
MSDLIVRALVETSLRVLLLAGAVALILAALRVRASGARHAAWTAVLCAMLLMPVLPYPVARLAITIPSLPPAALETFAPRMISRAVPAPARLVVEGPGKAPRFAPAPASAPAESFPARENPRPLWPMLALAAYGIGFLLLLVRLALGWRAAARILRSSRRIAPQAAAAALLPAVADTPIFESDLIAAPVTIGVLRPWVLLPAAWRSWPEPNLRAVLAHEFAHVKRRDPLVAFLASINRCVFWFHPLAWWLQRKLAASAELACDDAAVRTIGEPRRYAALLLAMAQAMRRSGGLVVRLGVGIDGSALVSRRIERILRGEIVAEPSLFRKILLAGACAAAVFIVAACRQQLAPPAPLREAANPELTQEQVRRREDFRLRAQARDMSNQEYRELESGLKRDPNDLASFQKLLLSDWARVTRTGTVKDEEAIARRRAHILWLIETHPDWEIAGSVDARLFPDGYGPLSDPRGHDRAKERWLALTKQANASAAVLGNAGSFFESTDKSLAEELLLQAQTQDPKGPWSKRLGGFYASVFAGRYAYDGPQQQLLTVVAAEPHSQYADTIRGKLAESKDEVLLTSAALDLLGVGPRRFGSSNEPRDLATPWLERVVSLNPNAIDARRELVGLRRFTRPDPGYARLVGVAPIKQYQTVAALPEANRFAMLGNLAVHAHHESESADRYDDFTMGNYARSARERAKKYAEDLLNLAPKFRSHPDYGAAVFKADMVLASLAFRDGDLEASGRHMKKAVQAPASEELVYSESIVSWGLLKKLLTAGERDSVIEFLEQLAQKSVVRRDDLHKWVAAIRGGQMPTFDRRNYW